MSPCLCHVERSSGACREVRGEVKEETLLVSTTPNTASETLAYNISYIPSSSTNAPSSSYDTLSLPASPMTKITGTVKWFSSRKGFGFVAPTSDNAPTKDEIFVHHSGLQMVEGAYRTVVSKESCE